MSTFENEWSRPDLEGIRTRLLDSGAKSTLRGRRLRRTGRTDETASALWPRDYVALLRDWLAQETAHTRFSTLLKVAGHARAEMAGQVLEELLRAGWVEIEERRAGGTWKPIWVRFLDPNGLRPIVGLSDRGGALDRLKELKKRALCAADLSALRASVERLPIFVARLIASVSHREPWRESSVSKAASKPGASSRTARCLIELRKLTVIATPCSGVLAIHRSGGWTQLPDS